MASSFLIMYPDVPASALTISTEATFFEDYPITASFYGTGYSPAIVETVYDSTETVTFDLGTGNSRVIDHIIVGGIKTLVSEYLYGVYVRGSNDNVTYTDLIGTVNSFYSLPKSGPYKDDLISFKNYNDEINAVSIAAYRYFQVVFKKSGISTQTSFRRLYFGASFDMGQEPSTYDVEVALEDDADTWKYPRGHTIMSKAFYPKHKVRVEWDGVSDAKANEFANKILSDPFRNAVYLYTSNYKDPLFDNTLMLCRVVANECSITKSNDVLNWNDIIAVFEEI